MSWFVVDRPGGTVDAVSVSVSVSVCLCLCLCPSLCVYEVRVRKYVWRLCLRVVLQILHVEAAEAQAAHASAPAHRTT